MLTLLAPGHRMDPDQVVPFQSLSAVRVMLRQSGGPTPDFTRVWTAYRDGGCRLVPALPLCRLPRQLPLKGGGMQK